MNHSAFVHDRIIHKGGAEQVLHDLLTRFGTADDPIFTLFSKEKSFFGHRVITALPTWLNDLFVFSGTSRFRLIRWLFDYRNAMPIYPVLVRLLRRKVKKTQPTALYVSSFAAVKNIITPSWPDHSDTTLYLHSPMQYIRENYDEYRKKLTGIKRYIFILVSGYLKKRDTLPRAYNTIFTNSTYTAQCSKKYYGRDNTSTLYPALDKQFLEQQHRATPLAYYIFIGRTVKFVRELDRIIDACNELAVPLLIMGSGPDKAELMDRAGPTITFLGHVSSVPEKIAILKQAKGCINIAKESCGIGTMEALCLGVPVLGYDKGGTKELLRNTNAGLLIKDKDHETIVAALKKFGQTDFDRNTIRNDFLAYYDSVGSII